MTGGRLTPRSPLPTFLLLPPRHILSGREKSQGGSHKCDNLAWFHLDQRPANSVPSVRPAREHFRQGVWFTSYG